jgi:hypothetical protein
MTGVTELLGETRDTEAASRRRWLADTGGMLGFLDRMRVTGNEWLVDAMEAATKWVGVAWSRGSDEGDFGNDGRTPHHQLAGAEAMGSLIHDGGPDPDSKEHVFVLDLDHKAVLIPSSTSGHHHLIVNHTVMQDDYFKALDVLCEIGLVEEGYRDASKIRGEAFLRLPWIRKHQEQHDAKAALSEWLDQDDRPRELRSPEALRDWVDPPFRLSDLDSVMCTCHHSPNAHIKAPEGAGHYSKYWSLTCDAQNCSCENTPMQAMRAGLDKLAEIRAAS